MVTSDSYLYDASRVQTIGQGRIIGKGGACCHNRPGKTAGSWNPHIASSNIGIMLRKKKEKIETWGKTSKMDIKNKGSFPFPMTDRDMKQYQESKIQATVPNIPCVRILLPTRPKDDKEILLFTPSTTF